MNVSGSSQQTEENFRINTKRTPSDQSSVKASNIFVNNPINHNNLIYAIEGK